MLKRSHFNDLMKGFGVLSLATAALLLLGCGGDGTDRGSDGPKDSANDDTPPDTPDPPEDPGSGDAPPEDSDSGGAAPNPDDIDNGDPFLAQLERVWVGADGNGFMIAGYDANDVEIGRISVHTLDPDMMRVTHRYPRPCLNDDPAYAEDCADVSLITVSFAGESDEHWAEVHRTLPAGILDQRMQAMHVMARNQPSEFGEHLGCALTVAASASLCLIGSPTYPLGGAAVCAGSIYGAVCNCKDQFKKAFPDFDFDKICKTKK
jgi:hypothetical protein